jgi:hypothetical protein
MSARTLSKPYYHPIINSNLSTVNFSRYRLKLNQRTNAKNADGRLNVPATARNTAVNVRRRGKSKTTKNEIGGIESALENKLVEMTV